MNFAFKYFGLLALLAFSSINLQAQFTTQKLTESAPALNMSGLIYNVRDKGILIQNVENLKYITATGEEKWKRPLDKHFKGKALSNTNICANEQYIYIIEMSITMNTNYKKLHVTKLDYDGRLIEEVVVEPELKALDSWALMLCRMACNTLQ